MRRSFQKGAISGRVRPRAALLVLLLISVTSAQANSIQVTPIIQALPHGHTVAVYTVSNPQRHPLTVQIQAHRWDQEQGQRVLADSESLLVVPPLFTLAPQQQQLVRVAYRGPATDRELDYRLKFQEVPGRYDLDGVGVNTTVTMDLPLFFLARDPHASAEWKLRESGGQSWLSVTNTGNRYLRVSDLTVDVEGRSLGVGRHTEYILIGKTREWLLPVDAEALSGGATVRHRQAGKMISHPVSCE
jgi:fimbrial chaperone protein